MRMTRIPVQEVIAHRLAQIVGKRYSSDKGQHHVTCDNSIRSPLWIDQLGGMIASSFCMTIWRVSLDSPINAKRRHLPAVRSRNKPPSSGDDSGRASCSTCCPAQLGQAHHQLAALNAIGVDQSVDRVLVEILDDTQMIGEFGLLKRRFDRQELPVGRGEVEVEVRRAHAIRASENIKLSA